MTDTEGLLRGQAGPESPLCYKTGNCPSSATVSYSELCRSRSGLYGEMSLGFSLSHLVPTWIKENWIEAIQTILFWGIHFVYQSKEL